LGERTCLASPTAAAARNAGQDGSAGWGQLDLVTGFLNPTMFAKRFPKLRVVNFQPRPAAADHGRKVRGETKEEVWAVGHVPFGCLALLPYGP
jgi:hypothetical protein